MRCLWFIALVGLCGCAGLPKIRLGKDLSISSPADAGKGATLTKGDTKTTFDVPADTRVVTTQVSPTPATANTPYLPARSITEWTFNQPTKFEQQAAIILADTGTVDTSVRKHAIDVAERRWLLWCAVLCGLAGLVIRAMLPAWPALSNGLLLGAVLAFASWKLAEVPAWLWMVALGVVALLVAGYKRAEWDKNNDGIPDVLQK